MLIDGLPATSRTTVAILNDPERFEETARTVAETEATADDTEVRMREQTPVVRVLQDIFDLVAGPQPSVVKSRTRVRCQRSSSRSRTLVQTTFTTSEMKP